MTVDDSKYAQSGVSIDRGNQVVDQIKADVHSTHGPEVLAGLGSFGGLYDASILKQLSQPVLVASTDGIGTKVKVAAQVGRYESLGHDIVNHCINDILVQAAYPLFFMDYFASSRLDPDVIGSIVHGMAEACRQAGCALLGGETAEMPGVYAAGEFDVAATIVGVVERKRILPRKDIRAGDFLLGLRSSGPHTNGYTLIRSILKAVDLEQVHPELGLPLAEPLLQPHRSYLPVLDAALKHEASPIKALAHITGGGFFENIPRILPEGVGAIIHQDTWTVPPLFKLLQRLGDVSTMEMYRVFNMGIGMVVITAPRQVGLLQDNIEEDVWVIGEVITDKRKVTLA